MTRALLSPTTTNSRAVSSTPPVPYNSTPAHALVEDPGVRHCVSLTLQVLYALFREDKSPASQAGHPTVTSA